MPAVEKYLPHYTYDDWVNWEGRWEIICGRPVAGNPLPSPIHQRVSALVQFTFSQVLKKTKRCKVYPVIDYKIAEDLILQPDMLIVCGEIEKKFLDFPPVLIAEIFSPSTVLRDRNTKFEIYQQQGIKYYLMVDIDKEVFYLYILKEGGYMLIEKDFKEPYLFEFEEGCKVKVILNQVWENL